MKPDAEIKIYEVLAVREVKKWMPLSGDWIMRKYHVKGMPDQVGKSKQSVEKMIGYTKMLAFGHGSVFIIGSYCYQTRLLHLFPLYLAVCRCCYFLAKKIIW